MAGKIKKALLKRARNVVASDMGVDRERLEPLLAAAAVLALAQDQDYEWFQAPPPHTGLSWVEGNVMLAFRPGTTPSIHPQPSDSEIDTARRSLSGWGPAQVESLQCLALKALEGNLRWKALPPFEHLDARHPDR